MMVSDNVKALRAFAEKIGEGMADEPDQGYRSVQQFLRDAADEIENQRIEIIRLRATFHSHMANHHPRMTLGEIDKIIAGVKA